MLSQKVKKLEDENEKLTNLGLQLRQFCATPSQREYTQLLDMMILAGFRVDNLPIQLEVKTPMKSEIELRQSVLDDNTIDECFKTEERERMKICDQCPDKEKCWSCGCHEWWIETPRRNRSQLEESAR